MMFTDHIYLYGLLGLLIPLIIHLWSKKQGEVIKIGSIKYIPPSDTSKSNSVKLNELLLLFIRMLWLGWLCILMAGLVNTTSYDTPDGIALIDPMLKNDYRVKRALDTLTYDIKFLAEGYPPFENENSPSPINNYWQLFTEESLQTDTLLIISDLGLAQFKGKKPRTNKTIIWIPLQKEEAKSYLHRTLGNGENNLAISGRSTANETRYTTADYDHDEVQENRDTLSIGMVYSKPFEADKILVKSALQAIAQRSHLPIKVVTTKLENIDHNETYDRVVILSDQAVDHIGKPTITFAENKFSGIIEKSGAETFHITARLTEDNIWTQDFIGRLFDLVIPPKRDTLEVRQATLAQIMPFSDEKPSSTGRMSTQAALWPWLVFVILFLIERFYSLQRKL